MYYHPHFYDSLSHFLSITLSFFLSFFLVQLFLFEGPTFEWPLLRECVCAGKPKCLCVCECVCVCVCVRACPFLWLRASACAPHNPLLVSARAPCSQLSSQKKESARTKASLRWFLPPPFPSSSWTVTRKGPVLLWIPRRARFPSSVWSKVAAQSGNIRIIVIRRSLLTIQQTPRDLLLSPAKKTCYTSVNRETSSFSFVSWIWRSVVLLNFNVNRFLKPEKSAVCLPKGRKSELNVFVINIVFAFDWCEKMCVCWSVLHIVIKP